jgi:hypothetical protein
MRLVGIALLVVAAILAVLNLKRVAGLGMNSLAVVFMIVGIASIARSRKAGKPQ